MTPEHETASPASPAEASLDVATLERPLFANYGRSPIAFERGEGARLFAVGGKVYLDFLAGIATSSLGHAHPRLVRAIQDQAARVLHVSNLFQIPEQSEAARRLCAATKGQFQRAFFCNSGAEAIEATLKLARLWGHDSGRTKIVSAEHAFHGRTFGALAATGTPAYKIGFEPLPGGFEHVPFGDLAALASVVDGETCAVLLEAVQGEGGVLPADPEYLAAVQVLCKERGVLFILDEIQTGIGRLGEMYGFQHYGIQPDAIALAKGLGGGVPVGAVLAKDELAAKLVPGKHGTTFGGNPLAMSAVIAVQQTLVEDGVLANVPVRSARLRAGLEQIAAETDGVRGVRGEGLMLALLLEDSLKAADLAQACFACGLLVNAVRPHAIRLLPPLILTDADVDEGLSLLREALASATAQPACGVSDE